MKKKIFTAITALVLIAAVVGVVLHRSNQTETKGITLISASGQTEISLEELTSVEFAGTMVNGKGEKFERSFEGILLGDLLEQNGIAVDESSVITVTSADNYSAELNGAEILEPAKVYIATIQDGEKLEGIDEGSDGAQLVVFGDEDSKRCVRYLMKVEVK